MGNHLEYKQQTNTRCLCGWIPGTILDVAGINWGEPEQAPYWSNSVPRDLYMSRTSFCKYLMPPHSNSLDSFDFVMRHQFRKHHHVQIIVTASILDVQWVYCVLDDDDEPCSRWSFRVANDSRHDTVLS